MRTAKKHAGRPVGLRPFCVLVQAPISSTHVDGHINNEDIIDLINLEIALGAYVPSNGWPISNPR